MQRNIKSKKERAKNKSLSKQINIIIAKQEKVFMLFRKIIDKFQELNELPINYRKFIYQ